METKLLPADDAGIVLAARLLREGQVVGIPTETVYGLAANALDPEAARRIYAAKGRPSDNPLIVHIAALEALYPLTARCPKLAERLAAAFWPGPLTMIFPKSDQVPAATTGGMDTVAVRMPAHPAARRIIRECGLPLAAPSANLSGRPSPTRAAHVLHDMDGRIPLILDGGDCAVGVESTVVSLVGEHPVLLRPGYITREQLEAALGEEVLVSHAILEKLRPGETARSPGMKYKHYAPKAEVTIVKGGWDAYRACLAAHAGPGVWALCFDGEGARLADLSVPAIEYGAENDGAAQAHRLFTALRELDKAGAKTVYARCPRSDGVSMAVYNRLLRAAAFRILEV